MNMYRVKQFYQCMTDKMNNKDKSFVKKYLNDYESNLFNKLSIDEQKHSVRVAYDIDQICKDSKENLDKNKLIKVALLHDIGKVTYKLNVVDKSILVILDGLSKGKIKRYSSLKKIDAYYNHAEKGYCILKNKGYDESFLYLIKNHHNKSIIENKELNILRFCDDKN
ncbi:HD domain-containing protein [Clostridium lundense]|uniref:HD domain-containing protein n=1 Tax=Clostridium lundense TaxID=319475 RepID=UPI000485328E|nr:HD domain-containing protein [Clostridium lundense]